MSELLAVNKISAGYANNIVLNDISFTVNKGEFVGIIGPNGSGKSTLLKVLSKVLNPASGEIIFNGKNLSELSSRDLAKQVAFVSQETIINFPFTVWEIVLMGRLPFIGRLKLETTRDFDIARKSLLETNALDLSDRLIGELSAGERQRVIIAKALAQEPILLFLDEPTAHLDISYTSEILNLLKKLNASTGLTVIMVVHDLNLASEYCGRLILLKSGRIIKDGSINEVLTKKNIDFAYDTDVIVEKNPATKKPLILLTAQKTKGEHIL